MLLNLRKCMRFYGRVHLHWGNINVYSKAILHFLCCINMWYCIRTNKINSVFILVGILLIKEHNMHDDVIKWKQFPRYWPFVRGIHRSPVNSPHKGQWRGALMFSLICAWINSWVNNREAGNLRRHRAHYGVTVMVIYTESKLFDATTQWRYIIIIHV